MVSRGRRYRRRSYTQVIAWTSSIGDARSERVYIILTILSIFIVKVMVNVQVEGNLIDFDDFSISVLNMDNFICITGPDQRPAKL